MYCLLVLALLSLVAQSQGESLSDIDNEGVHLNARLFSTEGDAMSPDKSLEYLKKLDRIYAILDQKIFESLRSEVRSLLELSDVRRVHCSYFGLADYNSLIEANKRDRQLNIVAYLEHFRREALVFCKGRWAMLLAEELKQVEPTERESLGGLAESVAQANAGFSQQFPFYSNKSLVGGVSSFVQKSVAPEPEVMEYSRKELEQKCKSAVVGLCASVAEKLHFSFNIYRQLMEEDDLVELMAPEAAELMVSARICDQILEEPERICRESYWSS